MEKTSFGSRLRTLSRQLRFCPCQALWLRFVAVVSQYYHVLTSVQVFGRRSTILAAIGLFALGSALCGSAQSMEWLIIARSESLTSGATEILTGSTAIEGAGGGAIQSITSIIVSDLVSLEERAMYNGIIGL